MNEREEQIKEMCKYIIALQGGYADADVYIKYSRADDDDKLYLDETLTSAILDTYRHVIVAEIAEQFADNEHPPRLPSAAKYIVMFEARLSREAFITDATKEILSNNLFAVYCTLWITAVQYEKGTGKVGERVKLTFDVPLVSADYSRNLNEKGSILVDDILRTIAAKTKSN